MFAKGLSFLDVSFDYKRPLIIYSKGGGDPQCTLYIFTETAERGGGGSRDVPGGRVGMEGGGEKAVGGGGERWRRGGKGGGRGGGRAN